MSKTILIGNNTKLINTYSLNFNIYLGTEVMVMKDHNDAISLLKLLQGGIDLIVTKAFIDDIETAHEVYLYMKENNIKVPLLVIGEESKIPDHTKTTMGAGASPQDLVKKCAKLLGVTAKSMAHQPVGEYFPIPITSVSNLDMTNYDIYLRVKKGEEDFQYIKRIHAKDIIPKDMLKRYQEDGVDKLYIDAVNRLKFINGYTETIISKLEDPELKADERLGATESASMAVYDDLAQNGLTENTVKLANACLKSIYKSVKENKTLANLLKNLISQKTSYAFRHCQLINYVCHYIIDNIEWGSDEQKEKMTFVAFFHDIALTDAELMKIETLKDLEIANLSPEKKDLVLKHAQFAAEIIQGFPNSPIGSDVIIKQHHGSRNGIGMPEIMTPEISPLAQVFVIAESFACKVLKSPDALKIDRQKIADEMAKRFTREKHVKIIELLAKIKF